MSRWQFGNWLISEAHQANIANPFAQADAHLRGVREAAAFFLATDADAAVRQLKRLGVRYVMVTPLWDDVADLARHVAPGPPRLVEMTGAASHPAPAFYRTVNSRMLIFDGLETTVDGTVSPPLRRLRLDFESAGDGSEPGWRGSFCKVFELVAGARLLGTAAAGEGIDLVLYLVTNRGRTIAYRDRAAAGPDGRFEFLVPYATDGGGGGAVRALGPYEITASSRRAAIAVPEADVQGGREVRVDIDRAAH
jgi:asparagine N-glycosylation enzyme membrane subunit Stt3